MIFGSPGFFAFQHPANREGTCEMQWIEAKYNIANRTGEVVGERTTLLNLNHVRRILKGNNGEAIIRWNSNTANMTLNETYDSFNERLFGEIVEAPSP